MKSGLVFASGSSFLLDVIAVIVIIILIIAFLWIRHRHKEEERQLVEKIAAYGAQEQKRSEQKKEEQA